MELAIKILGIALGVIVAGWGVFHQLIVGAAASIMKHPDENESRLFVMSWVAQGGFTTFLGILPATMMLIYGIYPPAVHAVMTLSAIALILLSAHVFFTGYGTHMKPIRIGAVLEGVYGIFLIVSVIWLG